MKQDQPGKNSIDGDGMIRCYPLVADKDIATDLYPCCDEAVNDTSIDSASVSLTQPGSLLSSFSNDTQEDPNSSPFRYVWEEEHLRHRRNRLEEEPHTVFDDGDDRLESCSMEEDYSDDESDSHTKRRKRWSYGQKHRMDLLRIVALLAAAVWTGSTVVWAIRATIRYSRRWRLPSRVKIDLVLQRISRQSVAKGLTVRLRGNRVDLLHHSLDRLAFCPIVHSVLIDWTEPNYHMPHELIYHGSQKAEPWTSHSKVATPGVLLLDEGILLGCDELGKAFIEWAHDPTRVIGFVPWRRPKDAGYALVTDEAMLIHRMYLSTIPRARLSLPCQHLAVSAWITALTNKPPIAMATEPTLLTKLRDAPYQCYNEALDASGLSSFPSGEMASLGHS